MNELKLPTITANSLTKVFKNGRGVKNISFKIYDGETFGIIGESGAGKSTIIRLLMGFLRPTSGSSYINGLNTYSSDSEVKNYVSYVPGEFNLFDLKTGTDFLKFIAKIENSNIENANELIKRFQLDVRAYPKRMSKGMKQKMALVSCFMKDCPVYILDEPSIGLDPLMREELISLINDFHNKGKTIILTTNNYEEIIRLCDKVLVISNGEVIELLDLKEKINKKIIHFKFKSEPEEIRKVLEKYQLSINGDVVEVSIPSNELGTFFKIMSDISITDFNINEFNLEEYVTKKMEEHHHEKEKEILL